MQSRGQVSVPALQSWRTTKLKAEKESFSKWKKWRRGCCGWKEKTVPRLGCVSQDSEPSGLPKSVKYRESRGVKFWDESDEYDSHSLRYVKQVSEKIEDCRLEKYKSTCIIREVPTMWSLRTDLKKRLKEQERFARGKAWNLTIHIYKLKEKDQSYIPLAREAGSPWCLSKRVRGERVCGGFRCEYAYGQWERLWICWVGDHEDIEESDDGDDGQRRGANQRRSHGKCQRIGLIRDSDASWRTSRGSFTRRSSAKIMGTPTTGPVVKNHISPKRAQDSIAIWRTTYHSFEFFHFIFTCFFNMFIAGFFFRHGKSSNRKMWDYEWGVTGEAGRGSAETEKHKIKMKTTKNYEVNYCKMCRDGYRISKRNRWIRMFNQINTLPALLMNYQWSREQKWYWVRVSTVSFLTSRKTEIVTHASGRK